jgi:hypothetical protein
MLCPECGNQFKGVVCVLCRARRARNGMLLHQRRFLETWLAGSIELRVRRKGGQPHLELFDDRWHTYCGIDLFDVPPLREHVRDLPTDLCLECLKVFDRLVQEVET